MLTEHFGIEVGPVELAASARLRQAIAYGALGEARPVLDSTEPLLLRRRQENAVPEDTSG